MCLNYFPTHTATVNSRRVDHAQGTRTVRAPPIRLARRHVYVFVAAPPVSVVYSIAQQNKWRAPAGCRVPPISSVRRCPRPYGARGERGRRQDAGAPPRRSLARARTSVAVSPTHPRTPGPRRNSPTSLRARVCTVVRNHARASNTRVASSSSSSQQGRGAARYRPVTCAAPSWAASSPDRESEAAARWWDWGDATRRRPDRSIPLDIASGGRTGTGRRRAPRARAATSADGESRPGLDATTNQPTGAYGGRRWVPLEFLGWVSGELWQEGWGDRS
jgi:hypothetical protein